MWTLILLICSQPDDPNGRRGRMSIKDYKAQGVFTVVMEDLQLKDEGRYRCGIDQPDHDLSFIVNLQVFYESVSVPVLKFSSPPDVSCSGGLVTISCESARGSLPIHYTWSEKTPYQDSKISDTNKLDLHCQSFTQQHHQYYCTTKNQQATKNSVMVNVAVISKSEKNCSYEAQISNIEQQYSCEVSSTTAPSTSANTQNQSLKNTRLLCIIVGVLGAILAVFAFSLLWYMKKMKKLNSPIICSRRDKHPNDNQKLTAAEETIINSDVNVTESSSPETHGNGNVQFNKNENGIHYAAVQIQRKSPARTSEVERGTISNADSVIYSAINI
ncbi:uncharacterized protein LOC125463024 isoform X2 [Stegostoma tigrinum]|uniref:uncharacterized protein LOC125463024 isoform X2 n=1 Tax=Stegostoma tigrinum TaxID=3053191 RepID=UPI00286FF58B|nr:uncharacterized protein LOC125463024 isoform X2 [Stegostoma tigrinum]